MISFFTIARAFVGHADLIQRNALRSWRRLEHDCEVILLGDDGGSADVAREFGFIHVPDVARNEYGSMLVNDVFAKAEAHARHDLMCYVSADIILLDDFMTAAQRVHALGRPFLMGGRRWDLDVRQAISFDAGWESRLRHEIAVRGWLDSHECVDYFLYTRGLLAEIPPFAIGRKRWDRWIQHRALSGPGLYIDSTEAVTVIHQNHDYGALGFLGHKRGPESRRNVELAGDRFCDLRQARLKLTPRGLRPAVDWPRLKWRVDRAVRPLAAAIGRIESFARATPWLRRARRLVRVSKALRRFIRSGSPRRTERIGIVGFHGAARELGIKLAERGHVVVGVDCDGASRHDLEIARLVRNSGGRLTVHRNSEKAIYKANVIVLAVDTRSTDEGGLTPDRLLAACKPIGDVLAGACGYRLVAVVSTVIPGWTANLIQPALERISGKAVGVDFGLCYWALQATEGDSSGGVSATLAPIGESDPASGRHLARLAADAWSTRAPVIRTTLFEAETAGLMRCVNA